MKVPAILIALFLLYACGETVERENGRAIPAYQNPVVKPYTEALKSEPDAVDLLDSRSRALLQIRQPELAVKDLETALKADSLNTAFMIRAADIHLMLENPAPAISLLEKALTLESGKADWQLMLSRAFLQNGENRRAREVVDQVLKKYPDYPDAYLWKGTVEWSAGNRKKAFALAEKALNLEPGFRKAIFQIGDWKAELGDIEAVDFYKQAFLLDSLDVTPLLAIGQYYETHSMPEQAKEAYRICVINDPDYSTAYYRMGKVLAWQDSVEKAVRHYQMAIKTKPGYAEAYLELSKCLERMGQEEQARQAKRQARRLNPSVSEPE